jgi:hypothetical protein
MGATVVTNKGLFAFVPTVSAETVYVLFEETYSKNTHPHTPRWSCIFIGNIRSAIQRIFSDAAVCEGGMVQTRKGHIRPELYLSDWMRRFKTPALLNNRRIALTFGDTWRSAVTPEKALQIRAQCDARTTEVLDQLEKERRVEINLYDDIDVIHQLLRLGNVQPWHIFEHWPGYMGLGDGVPSLGYSPDKAKTFSLTIPNALRFGQEDVLLQDDQGHWRCHGWAYSVVEEFIRERWRDELIEPGSFKKRIEAYRSAIESAPTISDEISIELDTSMLDTLEDWKVQSVKRFLAEEGAVSGSSKIIVTDDNAYSAAHLPKEIVTWHFKMPNQVDQVQQSLFKEAA